MREWADETRRAPRPLARARTIAAGLAVALIAGAAAASTAHARDHRAYVHVVRPRETLASIAQRYYGDPTRETVLVAENGLWMEEGSPITVGTRLVIPWVRYYRVKEGDNWQQLADRFYGHKQRAFLLINANDGRAGRQPEPGAELRVPYPVRHVAERGQTLGDIASLYYGTSTRDRVRELRRFNRIRQRRLPPGRIVLVPLYHLELSDEGRSIVERETGRPPSTGEVRKLQKRIDEQLPELEKRIDRGHYAEAVAFGNRLLGAGKLTGNQVVTIHRRLATAYVALGRKDMAVRAFRAALERQPDLQLDPIHHSPTVIAAFRKAKRGDAEDGAGDEGGGGGEDGGGGENARGKDEGDRDEGDGSEP